VEETQIIVLNDTLKTSYDLRAKLK